MPDSGGPRPPSRAESPTESLGRPVLAMTSKEAVGVLRAGARDHLGLSLTPTQVDAFVWYLDHLLLWNTRHNLTAIVDPVEIAVKHFLDSLTLVGRLGRAAAGRVVDVGTGAGFPGLPLKIVVDPMRLTLIEATGKKADFCRSVVAGLNLRRVEVVHARAEDVGRRPTDRQAYDLAVARAVAALPILVEFALPLVRVGGRMLAQKGESGPIEAHQADGAIRLLGGRLRQIHAVELPGVAEARTIVEIDKVGATPDDYPRRAGIPAKRPLS